MVLIALSLLSGWILNLFGFDTLLIAGMSEVFGVTMTSAGYYTMFGLFGMAKSIAMMGSRRNSIINLKDSVDKLNKNLRGQ